MTYKMILKMVLVAGLALGAVGAEAARGPRLLKEARAVKDALTEGVMSVKGANGIGLTACDSRTGEMDLDGDVYCVLAMVETKAAAKRLGKLYPSGSEYNGINFWIQVIGQIKPQPRMSGGK